MPFTFLPSFTSNISGKHVWIVDGKREICINFLYSPDGEIWYAATIYRKQSVEQQLTFQEVIDHQHTTDRRWEMRPAHLTNVQPNLTDINEIVKQIRRAMCRGVGCKGPRPKKNPISQDSENCSLTSSENSFLSNVTIDDSFNCNSEEWRKEYINFAHKRSDDGKVNRDFFVAYKILGNQVIYGASINHSKTITEVDSPIHYNTAIMRLEKCPVKFTIPEIYNDNYDHLIVSDWEENALKTYNKYNHMDYLFPTYNGAVSGCDYSTVEKHIYDKINQRKSGKFQIRGERLV